MDRRTENLCRVLEATPVAGGCAVCGGVPVEWRYMRFRLALACEFRPDGPVELCDECRCAAATVEACRVEHPTSAMERELGGQVFRVIAIRGVTMVAIQSGDDAPYRVRVSSLVATREVDE